MWNNSRRVNHKNFANKITHSHPKRRFIPQAILTKSGKLKIADTPVNTIRPVNIDDSKPIVNYLRPTSNAFKKGYSQAIKPFNKYSAYKKYIFNKEGNPQQKEYKEKGVIDSGCSRHMTRNKCYLNEYEDYDGGFVTFGDGKGRITRKGKIKTRTLDFDDVYFCKELKYNMFSVSQMCNKKNNVLFTDTECLVLSSNFKQLDESQVLLRVPRKDNIYSVDLKSVVPIGEAINIACYVLNRALIIKPHNKTPYEVIRGRPPPIDFMKPFWYPVTILNTRDYLGKFDEKADEGFFCRVFYVVVGFQTNGIAGTKDNIVAGPKDSAVDVGKKATKVDASQVSDNGGHDTRISRIEVIRLFLAYVSFKDFVVYQMDVKSAFLYGKIEEGVYVCQPPGFKDPDFPDKVYKVEKALCGLHQAPKAWYETFATYLMENGFNRGQIDKTLFIIIHKDDIMLVKVYVDDIIFGSTKKELIQQKSDGIFISQDKYVADILKKFGFSTVKTASTLMEPNKALVKDAEAKDAFGILEIHHLTWKLILIVIMLEQALTGNPQHERGVMDSKSMLDYGFNLMNTKFCIDNESRILDETVYKEWKDRMKRAVTTASSLEADQDSGNINRTQFMATLNEPLPQGTGLGSGT
nr:putative ribonuclease H-like domain-containing protein [Tanacetum cinerariifolium]